MNIVKYKKAILMVGKGIVWSVQGLLIKLNFKELNKQFKVAQWFFKLINVKIKLIKLSASLKKK